MRLHSFTRSRERWPKSTKHLVPYINDVEYKMCSKWRPRLSFSLIFHSEVRLFAHNQQRWCALQNMVCVSVWFWMCSCCLFSTVCSSSPRVKTRCSTMLWPSSTPSPGRRRRCPLCWLWAVFSCLFIRWQSEGFRNTKKCPETWTTLIMPVVVSVAGEHTVVWKTCLPASWWSYLNVMLNQRQHRHKM